MDIFTCKDAKAQGKTRYFTGKPCPYGHISERIVSTRACVECSSQRKHLWSKENPEKVAKQKRNWIARNLEKVKYSKSESQKRNRESANARNRKYAASHKEILREKTAEWGRNNHDKRNATAAKYRASKLQATPVWIDFDQVSRVYELAQEYRVKGIDAEVDHIIPLQGKNVCGLHVQGNFQIINMIHNRAKANQITGAL